jgi:hypothetical protein
MRAGRWGDLLGEPKELDEPTLLFHTVLTI